MYDIQLHPIDVLNPGCGYSLRIEKDGRPILFTDVASVATALQIVARYVS